MWKHSPIKTALILGPLVFSFALAMDVYMPFIPNMKQYLSTSQSTVQLTLSLFMIVAGSGQLILGPISDQIGRFKLIFISAILFLIGSILCAISQTALFLIISRVIQALGCCGLSVCSFAIVRDVYSGKDSSMIYSFINAIIAISPIIGPLIGVMLANRYSWHSAFDFLSILAILCLLIIILLCKESLPLERRKKINLLDILKRYLIVCKSLQFWTYTIVATSGMASFFTLFSMTPYIIDNLGLPLSSIYFSFGIAGITFLIGSIISGKIVNKLGIYKTAFLGVILISLAGIISITIYYIYGLFLWGFFTPCFIATFGAALVAGTGASGSLEPFFEFAGVASAMFGAIEFVLGALIGSIAMMFSTKTSLPMGFTMLIIGVISMIFLITKKRFNKNV